MDFTHSIWSIYHRTYTGYHDTGGDEDEREKISGIAHNNCNGHGQGSNSRDESFASVEEQANQHVIDFVGGENMTLCMHYCTTTVNISGLIIFEGMYSDLCFGMGGDAQPRN